MVIQSVSRQTVAFESCSDKAPPSWWAKVTSVGQKALNYAARAGERHYRLLKSATIAVIFLSPFLMLPGNLSRHQGGGDPSQFLLATTSSLTVAWLMQASAVAHLAFAFLVMQGFATTAPVVEALSCFRLVNSSIFVIGVPAPEPYFTTSSDVIQFFGPFSNDWSTRVSKVIPQLPIHSLVELIQVAQMGGFNDPSELPVNQVVPPGDRALLRFISAVAAQTALNNSAGFSSDACGSFFGAQQLCNIVPILNCDDSCANCGPVQRVTQCVGVGPDFFVFNASLSSDVQCGQRRFSSLNLSELISAGALFEAMSSQELLDFRDSLKVALKSHRGAYQTLLALYVGAKNVYEQRAGACEIVPCPSGQLLCSPMEDPSCEANLVVSCPPPEETICIPFVPWEPLLPPTPTLSRYSTSTASPSRTEADRITVSRSHSHSSSHSRSDELTRSVSQTLLRSRSVTPLTSPSISDHCAGDCEVYAQFLKNPNIGMFLNGITCGPGGSTKLDLLNKNISSASFALLSPAIKELTNLTDLYVPVNKMGSQGLISLVPALTCLKGLQILNSGYNDIGDEGILAAEAAISDMQELVQLAFNIGIIGDAGGEAIARAIAGKKNLQSLYLDGNNIGDSGGLALYNILRNLTLMQILRIENNNISPSVRNKIATLPIPDLQV